MNKTSFNNLNELKPKNDCQAYNYDNEWLAVQVDNIVNLSTSFVTFLSRTTGTVISYLYTIPLQSGLLFDWFPRHQLEPKTYDLSLCKQNMLFVEILKVKIVYPLNSDRKDRFDWLTDNNNLTSPKVRLLSKYCVEVRYYKRCMNYCKSQIFHVAPVREGDIGLQVHVTPRHDCTSNVQNHSKIRRTSRVNCQ